MVVGNGVEALCFGHHQIGGHKDKLRVLVDEFFDRPRTGNAINFNMLPSDPFPALTLLGKIVNGADTDNTLYQQPEGPGLEAVAEGFRRSRRRRLSPSRLQRRPRAECRGMTVYDALYAYCQEMVRKGKPDGAFVN